LSSELNGSSRVGEGIFDADARAIGDVQTNREFSVLLSKGVVAFRE
jgi:hypothetical protein